MPYLYIPSVLFIILLSLFKPLHSLHQRLNFLNMKFSETLLAATAAFGGVSASYHGFGHPHVVDMLTAHVPYGTAPAYTKTAVVTAYVT